jgi:alanine racemase
MKKYSRGKALVSLDAIAYNFEEMHKKLKDHVKLTAVIKADGYGHGALPIARMVESYDYLWGFAVATPGEALKLREGGITKPILILGLVFSEDYESLIQADVRMTVCEVAMAEEISREAIRIGRPAWIHLALDTGMTRIGFACEEASVPKIRQIEQLPGVCVEGLFTHFARADEVDLAPARLQLERYLSFSKLLSEAGIQIPIHHCSNSAGIMRYREAQLDMVRAGITIYGIYPSNEVEREFLPLKEAMTLTSTVTYVKEVPAGLAVSYGGTYVTEKPMRIATIPVGYADGYPRGLSNKGCVLIRGKRARILGRVCMDQFMVDVTDIPDVHRGDMVTLIGRDGEEHITMEELGDLSGRFAYEFACEISARIPRTYLYKGKEYERSELPF